MKIKANHWIPGLFCLFFATLIYLYLSDWYNWQKYTAQRPQPTIASLKSSLEDLPFADQIKITKSFDKDGSVSVVGAFDSFLSPSQISDAFKTAMSQSGWHLDHEKTNQSVAFKFCRDGIAANIRLMTIGRKTQVTVQLAWTYQTLSSEYCVVQTSSEGKR